MFRSARSWSKLLLPALFALALSAQNPAPHQGRLVEVNVIARDKTGPINDLKPGDFTLFDKGKEQKIASVVKVDTHVRPQPLAPNVFANHPTQGDAGGTVTAILLDGINSAGNDQAFIRQRFAKILAEVKPSDPVIVFTLGSKMRVLTDPAAFISEGPKAVEEWLSNLGLNQGLGIQGRLTQTVEALVMISNQIGHLPGRKNLVWVAGSYPANIDHKGAEAPPGCEDTQIDQSRIKQAQTVDSSSSLSDCQQLNRQVFSRMWDPAMQALALNNIAVYAMDAHGTIDLGASSGSKQSGSTAAGSLKPTGTQVMRTLAEDTGGQTFEGGVDPQKSLRRILEESEVTYTISYYPDTKQLDKNFHDLKVQTARKDADLSYRKGYLAIPEPKIAEAERTNAIRAALANPVNSSAIGLMGGFQKGDKPGSFLTQVVISASDLALQPQGETYTDEIDIFIAARTADGKDAGNARQPLGLKLTKAQYDQVMTQGLSISKNLETTAPVAEIRAVVSDRSTGKVGSLIMPVK